MSRSISQSVAPSVAWVELDNWSSNKGSRQQKLQQRSSTNGARTAPPPQPSGSLCTLPGGASGAKRREAVGEEPQSIVNHGYLSKKWKNPQEIPHFLHLRRILRKNLGFLVSFWKSPSGVVFRPVLAPTGLLVVRDGSVCSPCASWKARMLKFIAKKRSLLPFFREFPGVFLRFSNAKSIWIAGGPLIAHLEYDCECPGGSCSFLGGSPIVLAIILTEILQSFLQFNSPPTASPRFARLAPLGDGGSTGGDAWVQRVGTALGTPIGGPRKPQEASRRPQDAPGSPRRPPEGPRSPQEAPWGSQEAS